MNLNIIAAAARFACLQIGRDWVRRQLRQRQAEDLMYLPGAM